jgi:group I intron endonuclease
MNYKTNIYIKPAITYYNIIKEKSTIYKDNKNKSGIYRWNNLITNKSYIGSSIYLSRRFSKYYSITFIKNQRNSSLIYKAILKYGISNFNLDIIEYCEKNELINREQYYINNLNPEYNICKVAGSTLNRKHSDETKHKLKIRNIGVNHPFFGLYHSDETRRKISESLKSSLVFSNSIKLKYKLKTNEAKLRSSLTSIGLIIKVYDVLSNLIKEFPSMKKASIFYNISSSTIRRILNKNINYKGFYFKSEIKDNKVWVYDFNYKLIKILDSTNKTSIFYKIPYTTLHRLIKSGKLYKNKFYFYKNKIQ